MHIRARLGLLGLALILTLTVGACSRNATSTNERQHDCSVSAGDDWLRQTVGMITQSKAWTANGLLFVAWDEDDGGTQNRVLSLVVAPHQSQKVSNQAYTHYSLLATIENTFGVGRLGQAAGARTMTDLIAN